jgi:hypothetical protein
MPTAWPPPAEYHQLPGESVAAFRERASEDTEGDGGRARQALVAAVRGLRSAQRSGKPDTFAVLTSRQCARWLARVASGLVNPFKAQREAPQRRGQATQSSPAIRLAPAPPPPLLATAASPWRSPLWALMGSA